MPCPANQGSWYAPPVTISDIHAHLTEAQIRIALRVCRARWRVFRRPVPSNGGAMMWLTALL